MTISTPAVELEQGYESLRAQAVGEVTRHTPRGMAVFLSGGMLAWMCACAPLSTTTAMSSGRGAANRGLAQVGTELVELLAEMVLTSHVRCCT